MTHPIRRFPLRLWGVRSAAILTALSGGMNILSALTPPVAERLVLLERFAPIEVTEGGRLSAVLAGLALLLLAGHLWRRKHVAWLLTLLVLGASLVSHLLKGLDYEEAILVTALAVWLLLLRGQFYARSDPPSLRRGLLVLIGALFFTLAYGVAGFYILDDHFSLNYAFLGALKQTALLFVQFYDPGLQPITQIGHFFANSIYLVGASTMAYALFMLVRPVLMRQPASAVERAQAQKIVEAQGHTSLARFTLFADKSYCFSLGGSVVAYVVKGRVALALGDPIGPTGDARAAIFAFQDYCQHNDWQPAFYQTLPDYLDFYRAAGLRTLCIGHEAIVDVSTFMLEGKTGKELRSAVNRLTKLGYGARLHAPPLADSVLDELRLVSDEWLTMMKGQEQQFATGWFDDDYIRHSPVMAVYKPDGSIRAFANMILAVQHKTCVLDLMRRRSTVENGTMDFLFAAMLVWAKEHGYVTFSLGLSALSGVGEQTDDPTTEQALHFLYEHVNQIYNFKGLHAFKAKFHPRWEPRYLIYPDGASLPTVGMALVRANAGDHFLRDFLR